MCVIAIGLYVLVLLKTPASWLGASPLILIPMFFTAQEILGFVRHDRALKRLVPEERQESTE